MCLSDAFLLPAGSLELTVKVIDIKNASGILREFIQLTQEIDAGVKGGCTGRKKSIKLVRLSRNTKALAACCLIF